VKITDTITSFFIRRSIYFIFFGKPILHRQIPDRDQPIGDIPPLPLFIEEEELSDSYKRRNTRDYLKRQRRKVRIYGLSSRLATEREEEQEEPIDPHNKDLSLLESTIEPIPVDSVPSTIYNTHGSTSIGDTDTTSDYIRISIKTNKPTQDPGEGGSIIVNNALLPASPESDPTHSSYTSSTPGQQAFDTYLTHLQRAQEEQERLDKELERDRLNKELGLSNQAQLHSRDPPRVEDRQNSPLASNNKPAVPVQAERELTTPTINITSPDLPPVPLHNGQPESTVENNNKRTPVSRDIIRKPSSHTSSADDSRPTVAAPPQPYQGPKGYSLYDLRLQSLRPAQYFRAATTDGRNTIFMISKHKEQELIAAGRLTKER
ncbi:hypothetical protein N7539_003235, partial [Penicillium diatomitis]